MLYWLQVPDTLVERGEEFLEQGREMLETAKAEPLLLAVLIGLSVLAAVVFFWGMAKRLFKSAIIAGVLGAGAWYWYFNIH